MLTRAGNWNCASTSSAKVASVTSAAGDPYAPAFTGQAPTGTPVNVNMFSGNIVVTLSNSSTPTNGILVAGTYNGQVVVTLTPTVAL